MTHKQQFDDEQLEQMLSNAPKLTDHRSKDEVLKDCLLMHVYKTIYIFKRP